MVMTYPANVPVLVSWRRAGRMVRSVCFIYAESESVVHAAATLDGQRPSGHVDFERSDIVSVTQLVGVGG